MFIEKNIKDKEEVTRAIRKVVEKTKDKSRYVISSVPSSAAITRTIQLNSELSEKDIANEIELEADRYIPYAIDEVNLDFEVLGKSRKHPNLVDVLIAASKTEHVDARLDVLEDAGLVPEIMDVDVFAMERAFSIVRNQLPLQERDKIIGMIDIGATTTTLDVFVNGESVYTREQSFGGQQLCDEIHSRYGLSYEEAMLAIKYSDLPEDYPQEVLEPFKDVVTQQVARACEFFFSSGEYDHIDFLFLTGGTSSIPGLDILIQDKINVKTFLANPFTGMEIAGNINQENLNDDAAVLMNCCGLALRNAYR